MEKQKDKPDTPDMQAPAKPSMCTCVKDAYADLPPELKPHQKSWKDGLRKVTCPSCGVSYWTNRKTDLCIDCKKKGIHIPETKDNSGG